MSNRIKINQAQPAYKALMALSMYAEGTGLTTRHKDLIKMRASQVNGCAFCIDMHTRDARKAGETEQRIYGLSVWRDTPFFDEKEQAILALTEEITLINNHVSDETYNRAATVLGEEYLANVLMAVIAINAWNRFAITTHMQPALYK